MDAILQKHVDDAIRANNRRFITNIASLFGIDDLDSLPRASWPLSHYELLYFTILFVYSIYYLLTLPKRRRQAAKREAKEKKRIEKAEKERKREEMDRKYKHTIQELQAAVKALKATMGEIQGSVEELQGAVEELQAPEEDTEVSDKDSQASEDDSEASDGESQTPDEDSESSNGESQTPEEDSEASDGASQTPENDSPNSSEGLQTPVDDDDSSEQHWHAFIDNLGGFVDNLQTRASVSTAAAVETGVDEEWQKLIAEQDAIIKEVERKAAENEAKKKPYTFYNARTRGMYGCMQSSNSVQV